MAKKTPTDKAFETVEFLYAKGAIVNLNKNPRYPDKVKSNRPSIDYVVDGGFPRGRLILIAGEPSAGKCFGLGTEIYMYDGSTKKVEDIIVGDQLMGIDSTPRTVLSLANGREQMYWIRQHNSIDYRVIK